MTEYIRLNIAIIPPEKVAIAAIELSKELSKPGKVSFILDGKNFHPHVTCYSPEFPTKNLDKIFGSIEELAHNFKSFSCDFLELQTHDGYIDIEAQLNREFKQLHETIIEKLNPLREGHLREKYTVEENLQSLTEEQRQNIQKYGYPDVMELYRPHMTLTRLEDADEAVMLLKGIKWDIDELKVDTVGAFTMSSYGTCKKLLNEFSLLR